VMIERTFFEGSMVQTGRSSEIFEWRSPYPKRDQRSVSLALMAGTKHRQSDRLRSDEGGCDVRN
jgi:hypothetical protein